MGTEISPLAVRRSIWINASPERVWEEVESFERMKAWFGTGHTLTAYEPCVGGWVETDAGAYDGEPLKFGGHVIVFDPAHELTFENDWFGHGWAGPSLITIRLTGYGGGTIVELFHHGFEHTGEPPSATLNGFESGWTLRQLEALQAIVEAN